MGGAAGGGGQGHLVTHDTVCCSLSTDCFSQVDESKICMVSIVGPSR